MRFRLLQLSVCARRYRRALAEIGVSPGAVRAAKGRTKKVLRRQDIRRRGVKGFCLILALALQGVDSRWAIHTTRSRNRRPLMMATIWGVQWAMGGGRRRGCRVGGLQPLDVVSCGCEMERVMCLLLELKYKERTPKKTWPLWSSLQCSSGRVEATRHQQGTSPGFLPPPFGALPASGLPFGPFQRDSREFGG